MFCIGHFFIFIFFLGIYLTIILFIFYRYIWSHGITPRKYDLVDAPSGGLTIRLRQNRTSLTFRKIRLSDCDCAFTMFCDSRQSINQRAEEFSEETADNIEKNHVFHVYDEIAGRLSNIII